MKKYVWVLTLDDTVADVYASRPTDQTLEAWCPGISFKRYTHMILGHYRGKVLLKAEKMAVKP